MVAVNHSFGVLKVLLKLQYIDAIVVPVSMMVNVKC